MDEQHRSSAGVRAFLARYAPLEAAAWLTTLTAYVLLVDVVTGALALGLVCGLLESVVFYACAILRERAALGGRRRLSRAGTRVCLEFGGAEALDLLLRPALMGFGAGLSVPWGLLAGSLVADVAYYSVAGAVWAARQGDGPYSRTRRVVAEPATAAVKSTEPRAPSSVSTSSR